MMSSGRMSARPSLMSWGWMREMPVIVLLEGEQHGTRQTVEVTTSYEAHSGWGL